MLNTPLHHEHLNLKARMTDFAGWNMPVWYEGIQREHQAVRERAGVFDVSHMGRLEITGPDRERFVDRLSVNRIAGLSAGVARYTLFCDESGGVIDDLLVSAEEDRLLIVCNASNRAKVVDWMTRHKGTERIGLVDRTPDDGMIAVQGPASAEALARAGLNGADQLRYFHLRRDRLGGIPVVLSRTGYTGEDGFELIAPISRIVTAWRKVVSAGASLGLAPAGLGARDTLRVEAGLPLYGHEIGPTRNPIHAGLERFVRFKGRDFIGRDALMRAERDDSGESPQLAGLVLDGRRIARADHEIMHEGKVVGQVTSGTWAPTLEKSIAMGYVPQRLAAARTSVSVRVSNREVDAEVVGLPFYSRRG